MDYMYSGDWCYFNIRFGFGHIDLYTFEWGTGLQMSWGWHFWKWGKLYMKTLREGKM
jgi:hypothetical protein